MKRIITLLLICTLIFSFSTLFAATAHETSDGCTQCFLKPKEKKPDNVPAPETGPETATSPKPNKGVDIQPDAGRQDMPKTRQPNAGGQSRPNASRPNVGEQRQPNANRPNVGEQRRPNDNRPNVGEQRRPNDNRPNAGEQRQPNDNRPNAGEQRQPNDNRPNVGEQRQPNDNRPNVGERRQPNANQPTIGRSQQAPAEEDKHPKKVQPSENPMNTLQKKFDALSEEKRQEVYTITDDITEKFVLLTNKYRELGMLTKQESDQITGVLKNGYEMAKTSGRIIFALPPMR